MFIIIYYVRIICKCSSCGKNTFLRMENYHSVKHIATKDPIYGIIKGIIKGIINDIIMIIYETLIETL